MSCPDWKALATARDRSPLEPAGWDGALAHFDGGCAECRRLALAADPTLAFRRLPALTVAADEVEAMRLRVATLRSAAAVGERSHRRLPSWRLAAAAAVAALAVLAGGNPPAVTPLHTAPVSSTARVPAAASQALAAELASEPLLEGLDKPVDQVVQWNGDDLSVILVVDQRLGV
jgi:hypothetical protein